VNHLRPTSHFVERLQDSDVKAVQIPPHPAAKKGTKHIARVSEGNDLSRFRGSVSPGCHGFTVTQLSADVLFCYEK
jgi:hypothetical protein